MEELKVHIDNYDVKHLNSYKFNTEYRNHSPVIIYDGEERGGKSTKAAQDAFFMDPTIKGDIDRVAFTAEQMRTAIEKARSLPGKGHVVVLDEAINILNAKNSRTSMVIQIEQLLQMCGKYNIIFLMCVPKIFSLTPYIRYRCNGLYHMKPRIKYNEDKKVFERIIGRYYAYSQKKIRWMLESNYPNYNSVYPVFRGYGKEHPSPEDIYGKQYEIKKDAAIAEVYDKILNVKANKSENFRREITKELIKLKGNTIKVDIDFIKSVTKYCEKEVYAIKKQLTNNL